MILSDKRQGKPFIKWVGGKSQLLPSIEKALPVNFSEISDLTYIEPFVGGGAMLFFMLQNFPNIQRAVINDINSDLVCVYRTVRDNVIPLISELKKIQTSYLLLDENQRKEFYLEKRALFNTKQLSDIDNTAIFIFLNKTCFNGLYRVNSKGLFNVPFGKYANPTICDEKTLCIDSELLQKVEIVNGDFEITGKYITEHTFFYFDPPYRPLNATSSFNSYAKEAFNDREQIRLKIYCDRVSRKDCLLMLSNSDCSGYNQKDRFFDELYQEYNLERVWASRSVNSNPDKRGKLTELLIKNFDKGVVRYNLKHDLAKDMKECFYLSIVR